MNIVHKLVMPSGVLEFLGFIGLHEAVLAKAVKVWGMNNPLGERLLRVVVMVCIPV